VRLFRREPSGVQLTVAADTDVGQTRDHNEDRYLVADLNTHSRAFDDGTERAFDVGERGCLLMVADGMGGAVGGEVASQMAADVIFEELATSWSGRSTDDAEAFASSVQAAVEEANRQIHEHASSRQELQGMGTTATIVGVLGGHLLLSQVGDSRAYRIRNGHVTQLTRDQSFVQQLVDTGRVSAEEAARMPQKNVILQALGPKPTVDVVQSWVPAAKDDVLLLCSDGLTEMVGEAGIGEIVGGTSSLPRACSRLIDLANENGGPDNITVVLARVEGSDLLEADEVGGEG